MKLIIKEFVKGMGSITLFPQGPRYDELPRVSPWQGVAVSFDRTGHSMRAAIKQFDAQLKEQPAK
jgi:hypothetical protein